MHNRPDDAVEMPEPQAAGVCAGSVVSNRDDRPDIYVSLAAELEALLAHETDCTANLANAAAAIYHALPALNWAGFYLLREGGLVPGPFQGKPACVRIPLGRGICGTAAERRQSVLVADVHTFPGHIACDAESRSELVAPLVHGDSLLGILDLDSPRLARFDAGGQAGCEALEAIHRAPSDDPPNR